MTINATAAILLALYVAVAQKQGADVRKLAGTVQNDILKEYVARGTYIYPLSPSLRLVIDIFAYCREQLPNWNMISVSGYHMREAGATAVQEIAFTLAHAVAYTEAALRRGLAVDDFAPRLSFFFNVHNNFLEEVAKFRAARRLWARLMRDRFKAKDPRSQMLRFHAQTAGSTLTAQQPNNNLVRVTLQALAAVLGGAQSIHTNSRDEALGLPAEDSALLALRTQQIIAYESGATNTVDPVGGSYSIEALTRELEQQAEEWLKRSTRWVERRPPSKPAFSRRRFRMRHSRPNAILNRERESSSASTVLQRKRRTIRNRYELTQRLKPSRSSASAACGLAAMPRAYKPGCKQSRTPPGSTATFFRPSSTPSKPTPRWAKSQTLFEMSSASIGNRW